MKKNTNIINDKTNVHFARQTFSCKYLFVSLNLFQKPLLECRGLLNKKREMLENNLYHSKFDFYEKTKKSTKLKLCRMLYHYMLWRMKVKWYCQWNLYALVRYSNVVKVVGIAMPGVRSKRYALVDCTKFYYKYMYNIFCMFESPI